MASPTLIGFMRARDPPRGGVYFSHGRRSGIYYDSSWIIGADHDPTRSLCRSWMTLTGVGLKYGQRQFFHVRQSWSWGRTRAHGHSDLLHACGPGGSRADRTSNFRVACRMSPSIGPTDARPGALLAAILLGFRPLSRVGIEGCRIVCRNRENAHAVHWTFGDKILVPLQPGEFRPV